MTTLDELVLAEPDPTFGLPAQMTYGVGQWRFVLELADPSAGTDVEWFDITDDMTGLDITRGADEPAGPYRACVATLELKADDDRYAPWNPDTSDMFGVHVQLGAGLLIRAGWIRVNSGVVVGWIPRFTNRVESWTDTTYALGQLRRHTIITRDLLSDLVNSPIGTLTAENWTDRIGSILAAGDWPFGYDMYGAMQWDDTGLVDVLTLPDRPANDSAYDELQQSIDPCGLIGMTDRRGKLLFRPQHGDTFHAGFFALPGTTGDDWTDPTPTRFSYKAPDDDGIAYAIDWNKATPFGLDDDERGVTNHLKVSDPTPAVYDVDDPTSIQRYGRQSSVRSWMVANDTVVDDILARRAFSSLQARPLTTTVDMTNFLPNAVLVDYDHPVEIYHQTAAGRAVVVATGRARTIVERIYPRGWTSWNWEMEVVADIDQYTVNEEMLPPEDLAIEALTDTDVEFSWTDPTQLIEPTHTQVRISGAMLWVDAPYPLAAMTWEGLEPDTSYTFDVRYIRVVDGLITNFSPTTSISFTTDEATGPTVDADLDVDVPAPDPGCMTDWELQESEDGTTWTTIESGTTSTGGTIVYDTDLLVPGNLYRFRAREDCSGVFGDWEISKQFVPECTGPLIAPPEPFDDGSLVCYVPRVCPPDTIVEAVSSFDGYKGPAFGGVILTGSGSQHWVGSSATTGGVVATGTAPDALGLTSDRTIAMKLTPQNEELAAFRVGGMTVGARVSGSDYVPWASIVLVDGSTLEAEGTANLSTTLATHVIAATYEEATGELTLFVDEAPVAVETADAPGPTSNPVSVTWTLTLPADSWATDCAAWSTLVLTALAPDEISGLEWWVDAADAATITASGSNLTQWQDKSGNARHLNTSYNGAPQTGTRTVNGLNVIDFTPNDDISRASGQFMQALSALTLIVVALTDITNNQVIIGEANTANNSDQYRLAFSATGGAVNFGGRPTASGTGWTYGGGTDVSDGTLHVIAATENGTDSYLRLDGAAEASNLGFTEGTWGTLNVLSVGCLVRSSDTQFLDGAIAEIVAYDRVLTADELAGVTNYLKGKWGI
jgi:hypothetical protein